MDAIRLERCKSKVSLHHRKINMSYIQVNATLIAENYSLVFDAIDQ